MTISGNRVLLVDDEEEFTHTLKERLETRGLQVQAVNSGKDAINLVRDKTFDAIVLDLAMPGLDGIDTLKLLKEINPDLQIILLTGQATIQKSVEAMRHGAVDLMEKPADIKELLAKIEEASSKKALLYEKNLEDQIKNIISKKPW